MKKEIKLLNLSIFTFLFAFTTNVKAQLIDDGTVKLSTLAANANSKTPFQVIDIRDSVMYTVLSATPQEYANRLRSVERSMPLRYNADVQKYISYFLFERPSFTKEMLEKKDYYFPIFEKYLAKYHMPDELKYLAILESGLNPKAVSRSNAVGMWQFMGPTGREMGLSINTYIDERMNVERSTDAACRYLKRLYDIFGDWDLALASYNTGPGNIKRAIRNSGRSSYWDIHPYIAYDTRAYVPQFTAFIYLMNFSSEHGLYPLNIMYPENTREISVNGMLNLNQLADVSGIERSQLKRLNPHIKVDVLPAHIANVKLKVPADKVAFIERNQDIIYRQSNVASIAESTPAPIESTIVVAEKPEPVTPTSNPISTKVISVKNYHKIRRGDNLSEIADRYGVSSRQIKDWNNMKSNKILYGQNLVIYSKKRVAGNENVASSTPTRNNKDNGPTYYKVQRGDTLWSISQRYPNVTVSELMKLNNLKSQKLVAGQRIKIQG